MVCDELENERLQNLFVRQRQKIINEWCVGDAIGDGSGSGQHESRTAETTAMWQVGADVLHHGRSQTLPVGVDLDMGHDWFVSDAIGDCTGSWQYAL